MKPAFLTAPDRWTRAPRQDQTRADYACAVERHRAEPGRAADVAVWLALIGALLALAALALFDRLPGGVA